VFSRTTANGLLHKGGMFVLSTAHARQLLQVSCVIAHRPSVIPLSAEFRTGREDISGVHGLQWSCNASKHAAESVKIPGLLLQLPEGSRGAPAGVLLDVGAGDGGVTEKLLSMFQQTVVTETSSSMVMRLKRSRKYTAVVGSGTYDSSRETLARK